MNIVRDHLWIGAIILLVLFLVSNNNKDETTLPVASSTLERVQSQKVIRVGYAPYPPYVEKDIQTGKLSGYYVDIVEELANRMNWKTEWVETTWDIAIVDLKTGKFDLMGGPLYAVPSRWAEVSFTSPLGYFSGVAGLVKADDSRFSNIEDLNKVGVSISVPQGWTPQEYATKNLPLATQKVFPGDTAALALADVVAGNVDIALADAASIQQYLEQNPNQNVKALFMDNPPQITPASWAIRKGDVEWLLFLNGTIEALQTEGTLEKLAKKYTLYSYEIEHTFIPQ
jgi:ABC-type amino acid transport substrate-binding protein